MKKYLILVRIYDKKYEGYYREVYKLVENYRELRNYLVRYNFKDHEYIVFEETDIKIKRIGRDTIY